MAASAGLARSRIPSCVRSATPVPMRPTNSCRAADPLKVKMPSNAVGAALPSAHQRYAAHATPALIRSPGKLRDSMLDTGATAGSMKADAQSLPKWVVHDMSDVPPGSDRRADIAQGPEKGQSRRFERLRFPLYPMNRHRHRPSACLKGATTGPMHRSNGAFHLNRTGTTTILVNTPREHFAPIDCAGNLCGHHATHTSVVLT
jgi:hypothetical protein